MSSAACWLALHALLSLHFHTAQNYLPQVVPCTMAWALLKKIISQGNAPQTCPMTVLTEGLSSQTTLTFYLTHP